MALVIPETVPVKVGEAIFAFKAISALFVFMDGERIV